jgi:hypothetical protein
MARDLTKDINESRNYLKVSMQQVWSLNQKQMDQKEASEENGTAFRDR